RLGAPPEHVLGALRPLLFDKVAQLTLGEARAIVFPQVPVADDRVGMRAVPAEDGALDRLGQLRMAREEGIARLHARPAAEIAAGKGLPARPFALHPGEVRCELVHGLLRKAPVGRDLAAEYREYRRRARIVVHAQRVV